MVISHLDLDSVQGQDRGQRSKKISWYCIAAGVRQDGVLSQVQFVQC